MTLALPGIDTLPPVAMRRALLSQWFTPHDIARRMAAWAGNIDGIVLEPSAGSGRLLDAWLAERDADFPSRPTSVRVDVVELDSDFASLISGADYGPGVRVDCCDYLTRPRPTSRYALGLANPPYEGGLDGAFIAKMMDECDRMIALVRLAALAGSGRHADVWRRVEEHRDGWWMPGLAIFSSRPSFDGPVEGSAKSDFVCVKLSRVGSPGLTAVEWWA